MEFNIAVVGATGSVGREILNILCERGFPAAEVVAIASRKSKGQEVAYGEKDLIIEALDTYDFSNIDIAFFAVGKEASKKYVPIATKAGAIVVDNSSLYRMDPDVPLVVPEVNPHDLVGVHKKNIIANPNCSTAQMVVALKPLHDEAKIKRVVVSTYQAVSGAGNDAMDELFSQTRSVFVNEIKEPELFTKQIAFNVIPHIDDFTTDGLTKEEVKMADETSKIMGVEIPLTATCVRVPVFVGHSEAVNVEFSEPITPGSARKLLREAPGCMVVDKREDGGYITPVECVGEFATYISRIRRDPSVEHGINMWVVSDNLRKGAALNAVQIGESLISRGLLKK
ncbi:MAG: aspartate-semialdehyde dehydrogenase [Sphingomonadales bacterium]|nr:aspartate-semialdehyde dehydrogenase [Sphingomonadales bacterium]